MSAAPRRWFYGYNLAAYSFAICFLASAFFLHARGIFFPYWMADFGVEKTSLSLAVSLTLFTGACCAPITGLLIDRFRIKAIVCIAATWLAIGYLLIRQVGDFTYFLILLLIFQGIGWTGVGPLVHTKLMVNWFSRNRGMALGIAIMGISVAGVVMPVINTYLAQTLGWRDTYLVFVGAIFLLLIPLTLVLVRQTPDEMGTYPDGDSAPPEGTASRPDEADSIWGTYKQILTDKSFWSVVLTFGLMNGVYSAMITHLPTYLTTELTYGAYDAAFLLTVAGGFAIGGKVVFGWMMDHLPAKLTVMAGVISYLASTGLLLSTENYVLLIVAAGFFGLGFGGMVPVRSVLISRLFGVDKFSRANGLLSFFIAPATFWVAITGYAADTSGTYSTAFSVWLVAFSLAGLVSLLVPLPNRELR